MPKTNKFYCLTFLLLNLSSLPLFCSQEPPEIDIETMRANFLAQFSTSYYATTIVTRFINIALGNIEQNEYYSNGLSRNKELPTEKIIAHEELLRNNRLPAHLTILTKHDLQTIYHVFTYFTVSDTFIIKYIKGGNLSENDIPSLPKNQPRWLTVTTDNYRGNRLETITVTIKQP